MDYIKIKCSICGSFICVEKSHTRFTPDSELTVEKMAWICNDCYEKGSWEVE